MDNDLQNNYFGKFNVRQFNYYQRNILYRFRYFPRQKNYPSIQFFNYNCQRKSRSLINKLKKKCDRMNMLLKINIMLQDDLVGTLKIIKNKMSSNQSSNFKTNDNVNLFRFVKDLVKRKDDSSISNLIKYVKKIGNKILLQNNN